MAELNPAAPPDPAAEAVAPLSPGQKLVAAAPPPEAPVVDPPAEPVVSPRAAKLAELGFENVANDDEAFDRLIAAHQNMKNEFGAQLHAALSELKQTAQPTTEPLPAQDAKTGKWTWAPPAIDPTLPEDQLTKAREARQRYFDSFATKFVSDPAAALDPLLEDKFNAYFEQRFGQMAAQQQAQSFQQKLFTDNAWLFENDPVSGKPSTGNLSAEGKLIDQYMREAQQRGADYELAWEFAVSKHAAAKAEFAGKQTTQKQTAEQVNAAQKAALVARANSGTSRAGSQPQPAAPNQTQNKHLSFGERFRQNAERNGVPLNPVA